MSVLVRKNSIPFKVILINIDKKFYYLVSYKLNIKLVQLSLPNSLFLQQDELIYFGNDAKRRCLINFYKKINYNFLEIQYNFLNFYSVLFMVGLGFKNFILDNQLYILVGDCNYLIFNIPANLKVFCRKKQIYLFSYNKQALYNFVSILKKIKKLNLYKGKGILEFKNFKYTKLKVGKKQRFA